MWGSGINNFIEICFARNKNINEIKWNFFIRN